MVGGNVKVTLGVAAVGQDEHPTEEKVGASPAVSGGMIRPPC